ncbi:MAG TPA: ArsR family transcriptional regulator [Nitrososphaeraceae archaeon]|nr:ArsR family transcriptional regulator [Nitrososphaeraceae archaeon]
MTKYKHKNKIDSIQETIIQFINDIPGIRYRELLRVTGLSNGVLSYHLNLLDNSGRVQIHRINNRVTRYFSHDVSSVESNVIGLLRQPTTRKIILYMLESEPCVFNDIMNHVKKVPSTVSWHLSRLRDAKIVTVRAHNERYCYEIKMNKLVLEKLLHKYKSSFTENIVDDYTKMINKF